INNNVGGGWNNWQWLRRVPFGATVQDFWNKSPQLTAGMGPSQTFSNMADWHQAMTQQSLGMGMKDRKELEIQLREAQRMQQMPQVDPGVVSKDDTSRQLVDAIGGLIDKLAGLPPGISEGIRKAFGM